MEISKILSLLCTAYGGAGSETAATSKIAALFSKNKSAYDAMGNFTGDGGRKLGVMADTMLVGLANRSAAEAIVAKANLANGESNTNYKRVELIVTPWM